MESTESGPTAEHLLDTVYLRRSRNSMNPAASLLQGTQVSFHCVPAQNVTYDTLKNKTVRETP